MEIRLSENNYDDLLENLRQETLTLVIMYAAVGSWIAILFSAMFVPITPTGAVPLWLVFEGICLGSQWLKRHDVRLGILLFLVGYCLCNIGAAYVFASPTFLYLTAATPLLASILLPRRTAFV